DYAIPYGTNPVKVEGISLVTQLANTGGDPPPSEVRRIALGEMNSRGVDRPNELLASPTTALVLAVGYLHPGIRKGERFDIRLEVPPRDPTTSLRGGWLMETRLTDMQILEGRIVEGRVFGLAAGPVMVDPAADEKNHPEMLLRGYVPGGGVSTKDRDLGLMLKEELQDARTSDMLAKTINARFHLYVKGTQQGVGTAKTDKYVELKVHPRYKDNVARYIAVVRSIAIAETAPQRAKRLKSLERQFMDPITSARASIKLEAMGREAIHVLRKGIASDNEEVRFYSAEALAYLDDDAAAKPLAEAARLEPAFRANALTALSAMKDVSAYDELRKLLDVPSAETRYGAFRALWTMEPTDPKVRGEGINGKFSYHVIDTSGPPMIHVTSTFRPEVVLFGREHRFSSPCALDAGSSLVVRVNPSGDVTISKLAPDKPVEKLTVANDVDAVIHAMAQLGGNYCDIVQMLQSAKAKQSLASRFEVDALPRGG
ncbi:MAG: flagellar basal body P-ring protein FlgI, partial [Pirellulales bacterium]